MGGSTKTTQNTQSQTQPWAPTMGGLEQIVGQINNQIPKTGINPTENNALNTLSQNALGGNPFAPQINTLATDLLAGGTDRSGMASGAYDQFKTQLQPFASGAFVNPQSNPAMQGYLDTISSDIQNRVNGMFAGAGRDLSGANIGAVSRGITEGIAPTMLNQYNTERDRQLSAIDALYGGANTTTGLLAGLDQQALSNRSAGVDASSAALQANDSGAQRQLEIEAMRRGIPIQNMGAITGLLGPIAQLGQQSNSTTESTQKTPLAQQIIGGLIGGAGLASQLGGFGNSGWLYGKSGSGLLGGLLGGR